MNSRDLQVSRKSLVNIWDHYDLGNVSIDSFCRVCIPGSCEAIVPHLELVPEKSGFESRYEEDGTVTVEVPTGERGKQRATLNASSEDGDGKHAYTFSANVSGVRAVPYPKPLDTMRAKQILQEWAQQELLPPSLFNGELLVRDGSLIRATVAVQSENIQTEIKLAPSLPQAPIIGPETVVRAGLEEWQESAGVFILEDSVAEMDCHSCDSSHRVPCEHCSATGFIECPTSVPCEACGGVGAKLSTTAFLKLGLETLQAVQTRRSWVQTMGSGSPGDFIEQCEECHGRKSVPCPRCNGSGRRPCEKCSEGQMLCGTCGGDGKYFHYLAVTTKHSCVKESTHTGMEELYEKYQENFRPLKIGNPLEIKRSLIRWIDEQRAARTEEEVVRRIWLEILPVASVGFVKGKVSGRCYLVADGDSFSVYAPGIRSVAAKHLFRKLQKWVETYTGEKES